MSNSLEVDGHRPGVALVAAIPPGMLTTTERLVLLVLAADSFDGEASAPGRDNLRAWCGFPHSGALERALSSLVRKGLVVAERQSRRERTTYRLLLSGPGGRGDLGVPLSGPAESGDSVAPVARPSESPRRVAPISGALPSPSPSLGAAAARLRYTEHPPERVRRPARVPCPVCHNPMDPWHLDHGGAHTNCLDALEGAVP